MFKKIISTIFARALLAGLTFFLAIITTQYLGPQGKGDVSLFVLNLAIVQLLNNFIGGSYLVYLIPRKNFMHLLILSYAWSLMVSVVVPVVLVFFNLLDKGQFIHLVIISMIYSLFSVNAILLMGKEEIGKYNISYLLQSVILISTFVLYMEIFELRNVSSYINALYFSSTAAFIISFIFVIKYLERISFENILKTFSTTFKNGFIVQTGNIAQLFNYRMSFYILDNFYPEGRKDVGIYSIAVSVAEALWLIGQSVAIILYARISNSNDIVYSRKLTVSLIKIVFICTFFCTGILLFLPSSLFVFVFGNGFGEVSTILIPLSFGIVILSMGILLSSYFAGVGKPKISVIGSIIGLIVTVISGFVLIPKYGMIGAGITASASYTAAVIFQFIRFLRDAQEICIRDFIFTKNDFNFAFAELKYMFSQKTTK